MAKLEYTFRNDALFKMLFVKYPDLLKRLAANLLGIQYESIGQFDIVNPEIPPTILGDKFCRLDINMTVDGQRVDLEIQVNNEGDYPERSLYYWAREYSSALAAGEDYARLPRVVMISIVDFSLFDCSEFHSEYKPLEISRYTLLTDRMSLHFYELPKLPTALPRDNELRLWLALFKAGTEEELKRIQALEVPTMKEAIEAFHSITATNEFKEIERLYERARHNEAAALRHAEQLGEERERERWKGIVADKDAKLVEMQATTNAEIAELRAIIVALKEKQGSGE